MERLSTRRLDCIRLSFFDVTNRQNAGMYIRFLEKKYSMIHKWDSMCDMLNWHPTQAVNNITFIHVHTYLTNPFVSSLAFVRYFRHTLHGMVEYKVGYTCCWLGTAHSDVIKWKHFPRYWHCKGNWPVTGEFPADRPVARSFDVFFDLRQNKRVSKQWRGWWFETPSHSLWRLCNEKAIAQHSWNRM